MMTALLTNLPHTVLVLVLLVVLEETGVFGHARGRRLPILPRRDSD